MTAIARQRGTCRDRFEPSGGVLDPEAFKMLFRGHPGGVTLITARVGDQKVALTATSVASVSAEPPVLVFSVSALSSAAPVLTTADTIVVHFLDAENLEIAQLGATSGADRFADPLTWSLLPGGEPLYRDVRAWARCRVIQRLAVGGSTVIVAKALEAGNDPRSDGYPLVYHNRIWYQLDDRSRIE